MDGRVKAQQPLLALWVVVSLLALLMPLSGCAQAKRIAVEVDGARRIVDTQEDTVREALEAQGIVLGSLDRTQPALWDPITDGMTIIVTRVREESEIETKVLPFSRQVMRDEALNEGQTRLMQLGVNGEEEVTYLVTYENDLEVNRIPSARRVTIEPVDEIVVIGVSGTLPSVPVSGTVAYLSNGNAWMMRGASGGKRPLTFTGDLDERVLTLSPDGSELLYTRKAASEEGEEAGLNSLWVVGTVVVGDEPRSLGIGPTMTCGLPPQTAPTQQRSFRNRRAVSTAGGAASSPGPLMAGSSPTLMPMR
jgi:hypothetical protein